MLRFILSTLALIGTALFLFVLEGGRPVSLVMFSSLMLCILIPAFAVLAVWSLREWGRAWKDAFSALGGRGGQAEPDRADSLALWAFYEKACYAAAVIGPILGAIIMLSSLSTLDRLGPPLAAGLTTPLYSILLGMMARILRARVARSQR
jgi:flagellar motor component MotA